MINLSDRKWKQFKIQDLFGTPLSGHDLPKYKRRPGKTPFISASGFNNGVTAFINANTIKKAVYKNVIGVNRTGSTGDAFYQPYKACYQGDMRILSRKGLTEYIALFLCTCIRQQRPRFAYGFQLNTLRLIKLKINLPVDKQDHPDWQFMSDYMMQLKDKIPQSYIHNEVHHPKYLLSNKQWKQFQIKNLFGYSMNGSSISKKDRHPGKVPYVSVANHNNGTLQFVSPGNTKTFQNVIGVNGNGDGGVGCTFYHASLSCISGDVRILRVSQLNRYQALFVNTCIYQQHSLFSFGFKLTCQRLDDLKINLPVDKQGYPDWQFMSDYMKSMVK